MKEFERVGQHAVPGFGMFNTTPVKAYRESGEVEETAVVVESGAEADVEVTVENQAEEAPVIDIDIPVTEGENIASIEVAVEYAEKFSKFAESQIDALSEGESGAIDSESGELLTGAIPVLPDSRKTEGEATFEEILEAKDCGANETDAAVLEEGDNSFN